MPLIAALRGLLLATALSSPAQVQPTAVCAYPILTLGQVAQDAPVAIVGDVSREQPDGAGGYVSTLRVRGVIKGRSPGPAVQLVDLGHLDQDCIGGPRLLRGSRYVLFLAPQQVGTGTRWSLVNQDGGVYQMTAQGARFPPEQAGGQPQLLPIPPAELVRDAGTASRADPSRIEDLIATLDLSETIDAALQPPMTSHRSWLPRSVPPQTLSLAIAAGAVMLAGITYLIWRVPSRPAGGR